MNAYEITKEYEALRALEDMFEVDENGEFIDNSKELQELLDSINSERDTKLKGIEYIKREYKSINSTIDDEIKRLKERKDKFTKKIEKLSDLQVFLLNGEKVETDLFTFSFRKSVSVNVDDLDIESLDDKFVKVEVKETIKKADIKKALQGGETVKGAYLDEKQNLQVK